MQKIRKIHQELFVPSLIKLPHPPYFLAKWRNLRKSKLDGAVIEYLHKKGLNASEIYVDLEKILGEISFIFYCGKVVAEISVGLQPTPPCPTLCKKEGVGAKVSSPPPPPGI